MTMTRIGEGETKQRQIQEHPQRQSQEKRNKGINTDNDKENRKERKTKTKTREREERPVEAKLPSQVHRLTLQPPPQPTPRSSRVREETWNTKYNARALLVKLMLFMFSFFSLMGSTWLFDFPQLPNDCLLLLCLRPHLRPAASETLCFELFFPPSL